MTGRAAASRYARALFDVVRAEGDVEAVQRDLQAFADLAAGNETLGRIFGNPAIPASKKHGIVAALLRQAGPVTPPLGKLLLLLADRDRLPLLPEIAASYRNRVLDHLKVVRGEVTTAVPLSPEALERLRRSLGAVTGREVVLETRVDPSIIGGVVTRVGSTVFDGSVTTQLQKMKQALAESAQ